jgi:hypothetical protein
MLILLLSYFAVLKKQCAALVGQDMQQAASADLAR